MHISPTALALINAMLNALIFFGLYIFVRRAIVAQTKAKAIKVILKKAEQIESDIQNEIAAKPPGELGHYGRIRNDIRAYALEQLAEVSKGISKS